MSKNIAYIILVSILIFASCKNDSNSCGNNDFDQEALFANLADNLIIPSFQTAKNTASQLDNDIINFINNPSQANLENARQSFGTAYLQWQRIEPFSFGPSETVQLNNKLNNFPVAEVLLEANISAGTYNLESFDNYYSGFPALDYLLYGVGETDADIISKYTMDTNTEGYKTYLSDVSTLILNQLTLVSDDWRDNYRAGFVSNTGTAAGTSLSQIINSINENFEKTRRARLGIPSGFQDIELDALPEEVEAFYSGLSLQLLKANINASKEYFTGGNGVGLDDLLNENEARKENELLSTIIKNQYDSILSELNNIPEPLSMSIINSSSTVQNAYVPLANQLIYLKTDMPSVLCVSITYVDNASDSD